MLNSEPMGICNDPGSEDSSDGCQPDPPTVEKDPSPAQSPGFETGASLPDGGQDAMEQSELAQDSQSGLLVPDHLDQSEPPQQEAAQQLETSGQDSPNNMELEDTPKDGVEAEAEAEAETETSDQEAPFPAEFDRYMKVVEESPEEFNGWTYLLQYVEQEVRTRAQHCLLWNLCTCKSLWIISAC